MKKFLLSMVAFAATTVATFAQTNLVKNGGFEEWNDGKPAYWTTASTAGNATISQSADAHSGASAVLVKGVSGSNKRLGYTETTLKAGTYEVKFFAKAATAEGGSVRPGYVDIKEDGKANSNGYIYGDYVDGLTQSDWTQVSYSFELTAETKICLVVMNSKNPGKDVLIDDYELTTTDGGVVEGGGTTDPTDPVTPAIFSEKFDNGLGDFTPDDRELGGLSYVWKGDQQYKYAKASAYKDGAVAAESWLVSPEIDLAGYADCKLTFSHAANYFNSVDAFTEACQVYVRETGGDWAELAYDGLPTGTSWSFADAAADLKAYDGKKIQIAFRYTSTAEVAGTWEIKNLVVDGTKATGISQVENGAAKAQVIYTLDGRRVNAPVKGINIINGKKVLVVK